MIKMQITWPEFYRIPERPLSFVDSLTYMKSIVMLIRFPQFNLFFSKLFWDFSINRSNRFLKFFGFKNLQLCQINNFNGKNTFTFCVFSSHDSHCFDVFQLILLFWFFVFEQLTDRFFERIAFNRWRLNVGSLAFSYIIIEYLKLPECKKVCKLYFYLMRIFKFDMFEKYWCLKPWNYVIENSDPLYLEKYKPLWTLVGEKLLVYNLKKWILLFSCKFKTKQLLKIQ